MMKNVSRAIFVGAALLLALTGCQRTDKPAVVATAERQVIVDTTPTTASAAIPPQSARDPSLPDAATALAEQDAAEKAKAEGAVAAPSVATPQKGVDDNAAAQRSPAPQEPMTKEEETKAMPLPSQPNDHSTTALD